MRQFGLIVLLCLCLTSIAVAQDSDSPIGNELLNFMVGEWQVTWEQNVDAFLSQESAPDGDWQTMDGVSHIESLMEDTAIIERFTSSLDTNRYEQTLFIGTRTDGRNWESARTDSARNDFMVLPGRYEDDLFFLFNREVRIEIEQLSPDQFEWRSFLLARDTDPELIGTRVYTRLPDADTYQEQLDAIVTAFPLINEPPPQMADFHFWLGLWDVEHPIHEDLMDRIELSSGGHAMLEFWQVQNIDNPAEFFTMTIWDIELGGYYNWYWSKTGRTQTFTGGTCEGEGADKICRLAGEFYNITDESIDWRYRGQDWYYSRLEFPDS